MTAPKLTLEPTAFPMIRKPIAASIYNQGDATSPDPVIVVVCDDGSVWERALGSNYPRWRRQLPVPDTPASVEFDAACAARKASLAEDDFDEGIDAF